MVEFDFMVILIMFALMAFLSIGEYLSMIKCKVLINLKNNIERIYIEKLFFISF